MDPTIETILRRRSIRKYTDQPVEPEKIDLLLQAGMAAPTAMNCKPWEFVVVTDAEKLAQFRSRLIFGNRNAPAAIVVCGNPGLSSNPAARMFWVQDCSAAAENILIAAVGLGLGTVWIGVHPVANFVKTVRDGRLEKGMVSFSSSKMVMDNIDSLYAYLKGRSDGNITRAKVEELKP